MVKKTLCFSNPAYLSYSNKQLVIKLPEVEKSDLRHKEQYIQTRPIEDIGVVILENRYITITSAALEALLENNCAVITCDKTMMPVGLMLPLVGHTIQSERFAKQISASVPLKKQMWQQTVQAKIANQAAVLSQDIGAEAGCMVRWSQNVKSGDSENLEARAAAYYWRNLFPDIPDFTRSRDGDPPNSLLNYGYAILRALVARALVSAGLLPTLGIHHHNRYNAYCLADDIMEPYRPYVDRLVLSIIRQHGLPKELTKDIKLQLLALPMSDTIIQGSRSPLMVAVSRTATSVFKCFDGESRKIIYPTISID
jgi:CRISPR-associated protein Cas1